ncbi:Shr3p [Ascoidea rubescens DSM 1968]|uniref:Shr3 amino acid permease chaperone n=1 Tax=Ascoidea rubescens DSM 1968 TaxID=1344418 RepID=A0A1D2VAM3_9ASCO|nr:Shr3 amino acid permease chaperone [Ascoidea rubescens DSM 1968]ODV58746.1 Shr3 amino acid permease chaperone [Ascoidea rubescens DSM 1968]
MGLYQDLLPLSTGIVVAASSFCLGIVYANFQYDYKTLIFKDGTEADFINSLNHYTTWANSPLKILHILHVVLGVGIFGFCIKIWKPTDDTYLFDYSCLFMFIASMIIYATNLKIGADSCIHGDWGEVDMKTGINVMAASQIMVVFLLTGVLFLQAGQFYSEFDFKRKTAKLEAEYREKENKAKKELNEKSEKNNQKNSKKHKNSKGEKVEAKSTGVEA